MQREVILLWVVYSALYITKSVESIINIILKNMLHVSCVIHNVHWAVETLRIIYLEFNHSISSTKNIYVFEWIKMNKTVS